MSSSFERYLRRLRDPRWIPHISSYCDVRCERCAFSSRCWSFAVLRGLEPDSPEDIEAGGAEPEFEPQIPRRPGWAETHHIDIDASEITLDEDKAYDAREQRIDNDRLATHAKSYASDVSEILLPLLKECSHDVTDAMHDVYSWSLTIAAKTRRAVRSLEFDVQCNKDEDIETDPVQNDANGSAKVALVAIEQSTAAWSTIVEAGLLDPGLVTYLADQLAFLESELRERFPFAMAFVRPGFDEEVPGVVRPWKLDSDEDGEDEQDEEDG
jgi:hypothetical protein